MKFILPLLMTLVLVACEKNTLTEFAPESSENGQFLKAGNKVDICHQSGDSWQIINININAWPAHEAHGDAIDMDGDGFFDRDCGCSEVDCDDTNAELTTDCGSQNPEGGPIEVEVGNEVFFVYPTDNNESSRWDGAKIICDDLDAFGYDDWYLPGKEELNDIYLNIEPGLMEGTYWSSTSQGIFDAWYMDFNTGAQMSGPIFDVYKCRCIRK